MRYSTVFGLVLGVSLLSSSNARADVQMTMENGRVTIKAKDATLRQIMTEWARVGQTKIVNVERIPGGPMSIELTDVSEEQALATLMKPLSGYVAAPRPITNPGVSRFDRILVMPTVAAARTATATASSPAPQSVIQSSQPNPAMAYPVNGAAPPEPADDDEPRGAVPNPAVAPRAPVFTTFPQPQVVVPNGGAVNQMPVQVPQMPANGAPPPQAPPSAVPTVPAGVAVPGMIVPVPQQPGTQAPGTIAPPRRPGGQ
jgi:hypothetical protein